MSESLCRCLDLAEKIVAVLDGGEVFKKYSRLKEKIFRSFPQNMELDPHLKKIALENRELHRKLEEARQNVKSDESLEEYVINEIAGIQRKVLPNSNIDGNDSIEDAIEQLQKIVDSKVESNSYIRNNLTIENNSLREKISSFTSSVNAELESIQNNHIEVDHKHRNKTANVEKHLRELEEEIKQLEEELERVEEDNADIESSLSANESEKRVKQAALDEVEKRAMTESARLENFRQNASRLSTELETRCNDVLRKQASQRFSAQDPDPEDLEALVMLQNETEVLEKENIALSNELKRKRISLASIDNSDVTKLTSFTGL